MMKAVIKRSITRTVTVNCFSCRYGREVHGRKLPICLGGCSEYQLDCIRDDYEHWQPQGEDAEIVEKFNVAGVDD